MYTILIVDDEKYILIGLEQGIPWEKMGISQVLTADSAAQAKEIMSRQHIDIMLCDIEMPGESGLRLVEYAKSRDERIRCIFLTAYSDFSYAQEAVRLGCMDYILKPYEDEAVIGALEKAITEIEEEDKISENLAVYQKYRDIYMKEIRNIVNSLWREFVTGSGTGGAEEFLNRLYLSDIHVGTDTQFLLVLLSVDFWYGQVDEKTKRVLQFGIENIAQELFMELGAVNIFTDSYMNQVVVLYGRQAPDREGVKNLCRQLISYVNTAIECDISCYLGTACDIHGLQQSYAGLCASVKNNLTLTNSIIENGAEQQKTNIAAYDFTAWGALIRQKKQEKVKKKLDQLFEELSAAKLDYGYLHMYISGFSYIMYQLVNEKMIPKEGIPKMEELLVSGAKINNLLRLKQWTELVLDTYFSYYNDTKIISAAVEETKKYIEENYRSRLTRDDMAKNVCLNADYLSRIFHREMGMSISDYITKRRIDAAKDMLANTKCTITQIAELCGYYNFSYFTKIFKKATGISPVEFRKNSLAAADKAGG